MVIFESPIDQWNRACREMHERARLEGRPYPTIEEINAAVPEVAARLAEIERNADLRDRQRQLSEQRIALRKEIAAEQKKLDRLLDKRARMLFTYGVTSSASEVSRQQARSRLERTKGWRGNEYDLSCCREHIRYKELELEDLENRRE